jgi:hypothetical protein
VLQNKELSIIFGPGKEHQAKNYTIRNFITFTFIKSMEMMQAEQVACIGKLRNSYEISAEEHEKKRPLGTYRPGRPWA